MGPLDRKSTRLYSRPLPDALPRADGAQAVGAGVRLTDGPAVSQVGLGTAVLLPDLLQDGALRSEEHTPVLSSPTRRSSARGWCPGRRGWGPAHGWSCSEPGGSRNCGPPPGSSRRWGPWPGSEGPRRRRPAAACVIASAPSWRSWPKRDDRETSNWEKRGKSTQRQRKAFQNGISNNS